MDPRDEWENESLGGHVECWAAEDDSWGESPDEEDIVAFPAGNASLPPSQRCQTCGNLAPIIKDWIPQIKFIVGVSKVEHCVEGWEKLGVFGRVTNHLKNKEWGKVEFLIDPFSDSDGGDDGNGLREFKLLWGTVPGQEPTIEVALDWIDDTSFYKVSQFLIHGTGMQWNEDEKSDGRFVERLLTIRRFARVFKLSTLLEEVNKLTEILSLSNTLKETSNSNLLNVMSACTIFQNGIIYGLKDLKEVAFSYILKNANLIFKDGKNYFGLNSNSFCEILRSDELEIENEVDIFKAVLLWGENQCRVESILQDKTNIRMMVLSLISEVRFPLMSKQELAQSVYTAGILSQEQICGILAAQELNKYLTPNEQHSAGSFNSKPRNVKQGLPSIIQAEN